MVSHSRWLVVFSLMTNFIYPTPLLAEEKVQFKKQQIQLVQKKNKKTITVEVAETPTEHAQGLMFRKKLGVDQGMIFVFDDEQIREFWMKNTLIDLDIAYFDKNKKIIDIQQMKAISTIMQTEIPTYPSQRPAMYALEMPKGWFKKNKFSEGTVFTFITRPKSK